MNSGENRLERAQKRRDFIKSRLNEVGRITLQEIQEKFDIKRPSVEKDLDELEDKLGMEIEIVRGQATWFLKGHRFVSSEGNVFESDAKRLLAGRLVDSS